MEDQAAKMSALGLRVARIHSGLDRSVARQACADYLKANLQFLFIAPERLRVPGFAEMLAKRKLSLIAIDEAHCISQWGHDFRPDYRMLGQYLPAFAALRIPAGDRADRNRDPAVQADILSQLGMVEALKFIHGFRRDNLAIEVVEVSVPARAVSFADCWPIRAAACHCLRHFAKTIRESGRGSVRDDSGRRLPCGSRRGTRDRVQTAFQAGELEVVVATIAFGMGIDKANIRTVIHAGLPSSLEGYYQEIGRAGRDGAQSRTYLMHSYADQRTHGFFLNRDYPPVEHLKKVFAAFRRSRFRSKNSAPSSELSEEEFDKALEKLEIHGGARVDFGGAVTKGASGWKKTYTVQAQYRAEQFENVRAVRRLGTCRMSQLVRHFGDVKDAASSLRNLRRLRPGRRGTASVPARHTLRANHCSSHCGRTAAGKLHRSRNAAAET